MEEAMMEEASEPESQASNIGETRVPTESLIVLYKKVCFISLICAALGLWISDKKSIFETDKMILLYSDSTRGVKNINPF